MRGGDFAGDPRVAPTDRNVRCKSPGRGAVGGEGAQRAPKEHPEVARSDFALVRLLGRPLTPNPSPTRGEGLFSPHPPRGASSRCAGRRLCGRPKGRPYGLWHGAGVGEPRERPRNTRKSPGILVGNCGGAWATPHPKPLSHKGRGAFFTTSAQRGFVALCETAARWAGKEPRERPRNTRKSPGILAGNCGRELWRGGIRRRRCAGRCIGCRTRRARLR